MEGMPNMQSFGSHNNNCGNVTNSNNTTIDETDNEDSKIKQWLSPLEPQNRHQSVQKNRVNGVGG